MNPLPLLASAALLAALVCLLPQVEARSFESTEFTGNSGSLYLHHVRKRSFHDIGCLGKYDSSEFARLNRVCDDCYSMYRDEDLHSYCRSHCFSTGYFEKCIDALMISSEKEKIKIMVDKALGRL